MAGSHPPCAHPRTRPLRLRGLGLLALAGAGAAALALGGCGKAAPATLGTIKARAASVTILPVTSGSGTTALADVTLSGHVAAQLTCAGHGRVTLKSPAAISFTVTCASSGASLVNAVGTDTSVAETRVPVEIVAPAHVRWRLMIYRAG